jgi:hypothetical protein
MRAGVGVVAMLAFFPAPRPLHGESPALRLHAVAIGAAARPLTVDLVRWSTDAERAPLLSALSAPPAALPAAAAAGRGGRAGRGGARGGRGAAPASSPLARLTAAVRAAPTLGFIWGGGVTGYSIKYAWQAPAAGGTERIVLIIDRRLGSHDPEWPPAPAAALDADFTLIEIRTEAKGAGVGKTSLTTNVAVDAAAQTLALDGYAAAPALLRVTR